jgi:L-ascorbate metabolism protein UlaG (beta-lactamase superfamily)
MRATPARPDLGRYAKRFDVPVATGALGVTFLGVTTLLLDDGDTAVLTDGFFSRPSLLKVGFARLSPDRTRIRAALTRAGITRLDAVAPVHTQFDHALDAPLVAAQTGAVLAGGASTANLGRGYGLAEDRLLVVTRASRCASGRSD